MQSFGDQSLNASAVEVPPEIDEWQDPSVWTPEEETPELRVPDGVPEADGIEQQLPV
ncbi:MAG TPA: hypothetical protein VHJ78_04915 [Actinomycetota bacterium]|nr:hypothetical protein [Actinomycetota bacterium]